MRNRELPTKIDFVKETETMVLPTFRLKEDFRK